MNGVVSKFVDAASMFWQSLDNEQRRVMMYAGIYLAVSVALGVQGLAADRRETRIRRQVLAELRGDDAAA